MASYPPPSILSPFNTSSFPSSNGIPLTTLDGIPSMTTSDQLVKTSLITSSSSGGVATLSSDSNGGLKTASLSDLPDYALVNMKIGPYIACDGLGRRIEFRPEGATCLTDHVYRTTHTIMTGLAAGNFTYLPDSPILLQLSSTSTVDSSGLNTGATQIIVQGFNSNFDVVVDVFLMNGQAAAIGLLGTLFFRVTVMVVVASGPGYRTALGANVGLVYASPNGDALTLGVPNNNQRLICTMPINKSYGTNGCAIAKGNQLENAILQPPEYYIAKEGSVSVNFSSGTAADVQLNFMVRTGMSSTNNWFSAGSFQINANAWLGTLYSNVFANSNLNQAVGGCDFMITCQRITGGSAASLDDINLVFYGQGLAYRVLV